VVFFESDAAGGAPPNGGLPWDPFKAIVAPRPIAWISTVSPEGIANVAPFSFFNIVGAKPNLVYFAPGERQGGGLKDSRRNAEETGDFVCNVATWELRDQVNLTSAPHGPEVSEAEIAGLELVPSGLVESPRLAASPASLECVYLETHVPRLRDGTAHPSSCLILGEVVGVHLDERLLGDGRLDTSAMRPIARMGYDEFAVVTKAFQMTRPA
jgi:flavin reductase (DIM6/NTAB) family NADH-FMN oxidoreductase RutF